MTTTARLLVTLVGLLLAAAPATAFDRIGVVLLHGKTGAPSQFAGLADFFDKTGYPVEAPEMCWSARRIYDAPLDACLADIDAAIAVLKNDGFDGIVVGGHSLGGLAALAYAVDHPDLAGVIALAPAGEPGNFNRHAAVAASVKNAERLMADGQGDAVATFTDRVLGRDQPVKATPRAFLSFLGNDSQLNPAALLPKLDAPLLWVAGTRDASQHNAAALFERAPTNALSQFVTVNATHLGTPGAATNVMLDWLFQLEGN